VKGWYDTDYQKADGSLALGYHELGVPHHFFSRLTPKGDEFARWQSLSRTGKLAWFWNMLHREVILQLQCLPKSNWRIVKLEELDYEAYKQLAHFAGIESSMGMQRFTSIMSSRPGSLWRRRELGEWTPRELREFSEEVGTAAALVGYGTEFDAQWRRAQGTESGLGSLGRIAGTSA
jgi:hypothetical protein